MKTRRCLWNLAIIFVVTYFSETFADDQSSENAALNQLYENLLQREYAGPISFPDHQVERKAQRSPSLRLRFGRSDPTLEKRWFGDVNQKPIRSPSLRLRFGRRSDPSVPIHDFDSLMNEYETFGFSRPVRKPSRLRWGRSVPFDGENGFLDNEDGTQLKPIANDDALTSAITTESLRVLLNSLKDADENQIPLGEFNREIRKSTPLRLRFGRSTRNIQDLKPPQESSSTGETNNGGTSASYSVKG